jgi:hypothetical protein
MGIVASLLDGAGSIPVLHVADIVQKCCQYQRRVCLFQRGECAALKRMVQLRYLFSIDEATSISKQCLNQSQCWVEGCIHAGFSKVNELVDGDRNSSAV